MESICKMKKTGVVRINDIIDQVTSYHAEADVDLIRKSYVFSAKVHQGQTRLSGEPYLNHPLSVAKILSDLNLDEYAVSTGLLHDTVEDTYATIEEIQNNFGEEVSFLVDGVTNITKITNKNRQDRQAENFRKMILAMSMDIRVILIKLADRLHNMRTLEYMPPEKQKNIAQQTLDIYAPLANRLGIYSIKRELEDLSLSYIHEKMYREIEEKLVITSDQREKYVREVVCLIQEKLNQFGINARITGRSKHIYSIYSKMLQQKLDFSQIYDLTAFRLIVGSRKECFEILGIIHSIWKPIPGKFKDYISLPKANMYQSLHTTAIGPEGQRIEIQIRTEEMDSVAKNGIAAHCKYKEGRKIDQGYDQRFSWLRQVMEAQTEVRDSHEFLETFRVDIFPDEVYVFTPAGEVVELPKGSTPVDFAYRIHSDVGHRCVGAKINGNIAPLKNQLKSGDVVEILTSSNHKPSRDWLKFVKTSRAKSKIRQWIKLQELKSSISLGREICEKEFRKHNLNFSKLLKGDKILERVSKEGIKKTDDLLAAVGHGRLRVRHLINMFLEEGLNGKKHAAQSLSSSAKKVVCRKSGHGIRIDGIDGVMVRHGKCCNPIPGDRIMGYITRGKGVTVHVADCSFVVSACPDRLLDAQWDETSRHVATVPIEVICEDKTGLLAEITSSISSEKTNIVKAKIKTTPEETAVNVFDIEISNLKQLDAVIHAIKKIRGVLKVSRLKS